jgi:cytochrome P450
MSPDAPRWLRHLLGESMVNLDAPRHARLRKLVSRAFAPNVIAKLDIAIDSAVTEVVADVMAVGHGDFVSMVAERLPIRVMCDMLGIPQIARVRISCHLSRIAEYTGVRADIRRAWRLAGRNLYSLMELQRMVVRLAAMRRERPTDDLLSILANSDVDGDRLTARDLGAFFSLLLVAGNQTVQSAIAWGLKLFTDHSDQRELLLDEFDRHIDGAVDEILRYESPIMQFRRTLKEPWDVRGTRIAAGERVALLYGSANRDERVFDHPTSFIIGRTPNPHVAFGGGGPHYCIGAQLARKQLTALYRSLFSVTPLIRSVGPPEMLPSNFDNSIRALRFETFRQ